ncbi:MAG: M81 family metallopeptidase [Planctomycetia bacterium]|nr:M81 family metallopeptidase [Planctomycetia bacterium]
MRVGIISIQHESNTFAAGTTTLENFQVDTLLRGAAITPVYGNSFHEVGGFYAGLAEARLTPVPILMALAIPGGIVSGATLDTILAMLDEELAKAGPLDALLVAPHGAGVCESQRDMDGYWVGRLRARFGPEFPIVVTLDPHGNVSQRLFDACTATISYRTNPHLDQYATGLKAARLLARLLRGEVRPTQALGIPRVQISIDRQLTDAEPCLSLYALATEIMTRPGVLSASIALGFPYSDVPQLGSTVWVVTDGDPQAARRYAEELSAYLVAHRREFKHGLVEPAEAVAEIAATSERVCLLDVGDNVGGGSPADGTLLARLLHEHHIAASLVLLYDPAAQAEARRAGIGAQLTLAMGGRSFPEMGAPLVADVTVESLNDGKFHDPIPSHGGRTDYDMGPTAIVRTERGMTVMLFSLRIPPFSLQQVLSCGLDPRTYRVIVAKGVNAPLGAYRPVVARFIRCNTPGPTCADMTQLTFHHRSQPLYPFEE